MFFVICSKVTTESFTVIVWEKRSRATGLHLKTQRTTGNNWTLVKRNMQIGSSRGNYIVMFNWVHIWSTYTFSTCLGAPTFGQPPTTLHNRWKWCPEDSLPLVLLHPSPVGWALHLWMSLQCVFRHVSSLIRSTSLLTVTLSCLGNLCTSVRATPVGGNSRQVLQNWTGRWQEVGQFTV